MLPIGKLEEHEGWDGTKWVMGLWYGEHHGTHYRTKLSIDELHKHQFEQPNN